MTSCILSYLPDLHNHELSQTGDNSILLNASRQQEFFLILICTNGKDVKGKTSLA